MGNSDSQIDKTPIINKSLNIYNTDDCVIVDKQGKIVIGKCNSQNLHLKNSQLINEDGKCLENNLTMDVCGLYTQEWTYDASTGFIKTQDTGKCLTHNSDGKISLSKDQLCTQFNYGPLSVFTEKDRNGKCGNNNLVPNKLNYAKDLGNCDTDRVCSPSEVCIDADYRQLDYDAKYQYLYKKGKFDGLNKFTETDRTGHCGPNYVISDTPGYLPDSGKCDSGRFCDVFGACTDLQPTLISPNNVYDGEEIFKINTNTKITPPESNYNTVYNTSNFPSTFGQAYR